MQARSKITEILDTTQSNTRRGKVAELLVAEYIATHFKDEITTEMTKGSGAVHGDGDILCDHLSLDSKVKGQCKNTHISQAELEKIRHQAAKLDKLGAIVCPVILDNENLEFTITMDIIDFMELILKRRRR